MPDKMSLAGVHVPLPIHELPRDGGHACGCMSFSIGSKLCIRFKVLQRSKVCMRLHELERM